MRTWTIELGGTISWDIIWREADAETEAEAAAICAAELPTYTVRSIVPVDNSELQRPDSLSRLHHTSQPRGSR